MSKFQISGVTLRRSLGSVLLVAGLAASVPQVNAQYDHPREEYPARPPRTLVDDVIGHLRGVRAENGVFDRRQEDRYNNALKHLIHFQRDLRHGDYDKGRLDEAIDDVKNVVNGNPMSPRARDFLFRDLERLRAMRAHYDRDRY